MSLCHCFKWKDWGKIASSFFETIRMKSLVVRADLFFWTFFFAFTLFMIVCYLVFLFFNNILWLHFFLFNRVSFYGNSFFGLQQAKMVEVIKKCVHWKTVRKKFTTFGHVEGMKKHLAWIEDFTTFLVIFSEILRNTLFCAYFVVIVICLQTYGFGLFEAVIRIFIFKTLNSFKNHPEYCRSYHL